ncbi:hypothetical protein HYN48_00085 [Flavobacterium magnum]|uniref:Uncharacterized protein n=1 Tax=Flavobacterium magnum TaxID=2162713 RepID=A0A2S0RAQ3_9FLAO|nr:hypothetical protein [Flavobacterium magnum]AWA28605.1 hypothetical protein HYN48_00085 [Flavobacterium magnum]
MNLKIILLLIFIWPKNLSAQYEMKGTLSNNERNTVISELSKLSNTEIDTLKTIVINFYLSPDENPNGTCIDHYTSDWKYIKFFKKKKSKAMQFFITEKNYHYKKPFVKEDTNNVIKNLLFTDAKQCGNYIIIKPDGKFLKRLSEYRQFDIPDIIKKM